MTADRREEAERDALGWPQKQKVETGDGRSASVVKGRAMPIPEPEDMKDPLRPIWFRIHRDNSYEPSNVEARFLCKRITEERNKAARLRGELAALTTGDSAGVPKPFFADLTDEDLEVMREDSDD